MLKNRFLIIPRCCWHKVGVSLVTIYADGDMKVSLSWDPPVIKAHEKTQFVYQFYDPQTNSNLAEIKYDFIIF